MYYQYVVEPNSNLLCCICRAPFVDPVTTRSCSHTFCRSCCVQALAHARQCPVDRSPLSVDDLLVADPIIRSLVDELIVECIHPDCSHTTQRQLLTAHLLDSCPFSLDSMTKCESCTVELSRSEISSHKSATNGCSWSGPRSVLESSHKSACPYEAIAGFFALNNKKFAQVAQENFILRHKIETLEDTLQTMRHELQSVKAALGPWYRYASDLPSDLQPSSASTSSRGFDAPQDDFAAYFPSETADDVLPTESPSGWDALSSRQQQSALVGIRESVVALGSALDSLGRRADIALTNETMRVNEDIMSLRASIHGLRMQVHTIMMDRNAQVTGRNLENSAVGSNILGTDGAWPLHGRFYYPPPPGTKL
ncbi:hypothetical protein C8F01DRAFT_1205816 [Mycena amicta]|nr:hypothetical protein C8F01DRAFT_1205816 [Mycena amicta]